MTIALKNKLFSLNPAEWVGPILGKELRVSSRRRRNYLIRTLYLTLLTIFVCLVWARSMVRSYDPIINRVAWQIANHTAAAKAVTVTICVFQFWAVPILAIVMLSTSISDEITKHTLGVLMTTPITSRQIVFGKLFGKLLQLILLVALNLPVLAIVRVFGGIPWEYLISTTCVTLTTAVFCGCVSLFFSIGYRRAYVAIIRTVFVLGTLSFAIPTIFGVFFAGPVRSSSVFREAVLAVTELVNPYVVMAQSTAAIYNPRVPTAPWLFHCAIVFGASAVIIFFATMRLRKVALRQACGYTTPPELWKFFHRKSLSPVVLHDDSGSVGDIASIRSVKGSPVLWKELASPMIRNASRGKNIIAAAIAILCLASTYIANYDHHGLRNQFVQSFYIVLFVVAWAVVEAIISATTITVEKETQSWPILLVTPLSDWRIIADKVIASLLRTKPICIFFGAHTVFFVIVGYIHPIALLHVPLLALPVILLLDCSGLYFSSLLRKSTSAVATNLAFAALTWVVIPTVWGIYCNVNRSHIFSAQVLASVNPLVTTFVVLNGETGWRAASQLSYLDYSWPFNECAGVWATTLFIGAVGTAYVLVAFLFLWRAKARLRREIFTD